ncbi:MAG: sugar ABC transporter permease [Spirochaetes bacterium]|nr:sugar ABC transporter permease [Spirochaetota bacterium]MBU0954764.1 sugar ABC transporter permease [Spirochaetota bacterium]
MKSSRRQATKPSGVVALQRAGGRGSPVPFLLPALLIVFAVLIFPILFSFVVSLFDWPLSAGGGERSFVGLGNYSELFRDPGFWNSLLLQLGFIFIAIPLELVLGLGAALLLNREFRGGRVIRALMLLPVFFLPVVSGMTWRFMLQPRYGALNNLLVNIGLPEITWLANAGTAYAAIIMQDIWRMWPFVFMLLYAGLAGIPTELLEAAEIDGANFSKRLFKIILPLLYPTILTALLLRIIDALRIFSEVYVMTEGGPGMATTLFSLYTHRIAFGHMKVGLSSAMAIFLLIISIVFAITLVRKNMSLEQLEERGGGQ